MKVINNFKGTRDISSDDMRWRIDVMETIREVLVLFGFEPLETPIIERKEVLFGKYGEEAENLLFLLAEPHEDGGLRYDHTVPLARFAATHWQGLPKPYKRYSMGPVFRAENPQAGRFRQLTQCDFDTLGSSSPIIDAEIVAVNYTTFTRLGFTDQFQIQLNDRKLLNAMVSEMGFGDSPQIVLRAWDKLGKQSAEEVYEYVRKQLDVTKDAAKLKNYKKITDEFVELVKEDTSVIVNFIEEAFKSQEVQAAVKELWTLVGHIKNFGVPNSAYKFNPLLARGLSYYTGPIFETVVTKSGIGSLSGGGRYDDLIGLMGGPKVPASGSAFGLDRLLYIMEELGLRPDNSQSTKVLVTIFDAHNEELLSESSSVATLLRNNSIPTELYTGEITKLGKQISVADAKKIPFVVIIGPSELEEKLITLKDLKSGAEKKLQRETLITQIQSLIG